jgi:hypothetical protein
MSSLPLFSQEARSSRWYDSTTYASYLKSDWMAVKEIGKEALDNDIDFYYLRVRIADAYYYSGNYRKAILHYNAALELNSADTYSRDMKYYSYLNLGETDWAWKLSPGLGTRQKSGRKLIKYNPLDFVYLEAGISPSSFKEADRENVIGSDSIYGERELQTLISHYQLGARVRISPSLAFFAGYTGLSIQKEKLFSYATSGIMRDSISDEIYGKAYYYSFPRSITDTSFEYKLKQDDLYFNVDYLFNEGWKVSPAFHFFKINSQNIVPIYQLITYSDTAYYLTLDNSWDTFDYILDDYQFNSKDSSFSNYLFSLSVRKEWDLFSFEAHASRSDFNSAIQNHLGVTCTWYPYGNTKLYGTIRATSIFGDPELRMVYEPSAGGKIYKNTWLKGFVTIGNLDLYNDINGYVVYNQSDPIHFRAGADAITLIGKHIELFLVYRFYRKQYSTLQYFKADPENSLPLTITTVTKTPYTNQSFIGGIKWKL